MTVADNIAVSAQCIVSWLKRSIQEINRDRKREKTTYRRTTIDPRRQSTPASAAICTFCNRLGNTSHPAVSRRELPAGVSLTKAYILGGTVVFCRPFLQRY